MKGMGELHLDILVDRLKREFKVEANIGAPQVAYRETIWHEVEHSYTHKKQSGGSGQFAEVKDDLCRQSRAKVTRSKPRSLVVLFLRNTSRALKKASTRSWTRSFGGLPCDRLQGGLIDGKFHDVDSRFWRSKSRPYGYARRHAKAGAKLLEPIMKVEVITPEEYTVASLVI